MGLTNDPEKLRQWQQRSQQRTLERMMERGKKLAPREKPAAVKPEALRAALAPRKPKKQYRPPNDSLWRQQCIAARGETCRSCGTSQWIQMDHICPKSQGGKSEVENGMPLCQECHRRKTDSEILTEWAWLDPDQLVYLAQIGWVDWGEKGEPHGRGWKHFASRPAGKQVSPAG